MSKRLRQYAPTLGHLAKCGTVSRKRLLKNYLNDKEFLYTICECCKNILLGNVPLNSKQKQLLSKRKKQIRKVANKSSSLKQKKAIIQRGGFLSAILGPLIGLLGGLFTK